MVQSPVVEGAHKGDDRQVQEPQLTEHGENLIETDCAQSSLEGEGSEIPERRKGKLWKRKDGRGSKEKLERLQAVGQKRNSREVNEMGLEEVEMEEMRIFKKVGINGVGDSEGDKHVADEKVAGPTEWALSGQ